MPAASPTRCANVVEPVLLLFVLDGHCPLSLRFQGPCSSRCPTTAAVVSSFRMRRPRISAREYLATPSVLARWCRWWKRSERAKHRASSRIAHRRVPCVVEYAEYTGSVLRRVPISHRQWRVRRSRSAWRFGQASGVGCTQNRVAYLDRGATKPRLANIGRRHSDEGRPVVGIRTIERTAPSPGSARTPV